MGTMFERRGRKWLSESPWWKTVLSLEVLRVVDDEDEEEDDSGRSIGESAPLPEGDCGDQEAVLDQLPSLRERSSGLVSMRVIFAGLPRGDENTPSGILIFLRKS